MKNIIVGKQSKNIVLGSLIVGAFFFSFFVLDKNPVITEVHYSITPTTVEEVLAVSDLVVVGEVLKTKGVRVPSKIREGKMDILTDVTLKVDEVWFGEREGLNEVDFRVLGGKVGDEEMIVGESTSPEEGQKVLVFLKKNASDSESIVESLDAHYTLAARVHARFIIQDSKLTDGNSQLESLAKKHLFGEKNNLLDIKNIVKESVLN